MLEATKPALLLAALTLGVATAHAQPAPSPLPGPAQAPVAPAQPEAPKTVAEVEAALHKRASASFSTFKGWTVVEDPESHALWSFAPAGHPAYPAVIKRTVSLQGNQLGIRTDAMCQGPKPACDDLLRDLSPLDEQLGPHMARLRRSLSQ